MGVRPDESYCAFALPLSVQVLQLTNVSGCYYTAPAYDAVEYELRKFSRARWMTPWHGPPSDAVDDAWEALYNFGVSKIPKSDAAKMLNRTVAIPGDEENYVIALDVFHQLHCLNVIRQALAPDYYPMLRINHDFDHVDHCVNSLRESLMCSVDITPNT
ncbi:hypothetical protein FIBSPDRAFT_842279 [Athelia psychrophila]|uniref:Uncharacterized protein n=1 Tax=Athelia psychrophila TaxID=1759441 RepID=A0A167WN81_9AGAM|nr:hypothetical protein FIBSPDRAFT_842279 [Fibularhizoctonia sp. CBS 109695]